MIFLDSSYIKGLILKNDDYNHLSKRIKPYLKHEAKVINTTVLVEVLNSIKQGNYDKDTKELLKCLKHWMYLIIWRGMIMNHLWDGSIISIRASTSQIATSLIQWLSIMFKELFLSIQILTRLTVLKGFINLNLFCIGPWNDKSVKVFDI